MKGQRRARHGCCEEDVYVFVGSRKQPMHIVVCRRVLIFDIGDDNVLFEEKLEINKQAALRLETDSVKVKSTFFQANES